MSDVLFNVDKDLDESARCVGMLREAGFEVRLVRDERFALGLSSEEESLEILRGASAVIAHGEFYTERMLASLPELRVIARSGVGFDRVDVTAATAHGVVVTITPTANHEAVAEHALALIMALAKSIVPADRAVRSGEWPRWSSVPLRGETLGIVGLGRIGRSLAVRALALRMDVIASEKYPHQDFIAKHGIRLVDLDTLLALADVVSLHCPLDDETRGMIDGEKLAKMKPSAVLVNTARGGLVVEADLVDALESGRIAGAGLDVFVREPPDATNPLFQLENVVASPHFAGSDTLSTENMGIEAAQCIIDLSLGRWPREAVVNSQMEGRWQW